MKRKHYQGLDIGKIVAAILVISIHTVPLVDYKGTYIYKLWDIISSLAVPYFFVCSGYFIGLKLKDEGIYLIKKRAIEFAKIYLILTIAYIPLTIYSYIESEKGLIYCLLHFIRGLILYGNHGWSWQLWYLLCASYSLFFLYFLHRNGVESRFIWIIAIGLYIFGTFMTFQPTIIQGIPAIDKAYSIFSTIFWNGRMFSGLMSIWIGIKLDTLPKPKLFITLLVLVICLVTSVFASSFVCGIIRPVIIWSIFLLLLGIRDNSVVEKLCFGKSSTCIYYIHMYFVFVFEKIFRLRELPRFFAVVFVSVVVSYSYLLLKKTALSNK